MKEISLLIFSKDDLKNISENLECIFSRFEEVIIVDSSSPKNFADLRAHLDKHQNLRIYHVLPSGGLVELLRMYGINHCSNQFIFLLDTDEQLCEAFLSDMNRIINSNDAAGFSIIRYEIGKSEDSYNVPTSLQTRLFRKDSFFVGQIHEVPSLRGTVVELPSKYFIKHFGRDDGKNYYILESWFKPFTWGRWISLVASLFRNEREYSIGWDKELPRPIAVIAMVILRMFQNLFFAFSRKGRLTQFKNGMKYDREIRRYYYGMSREQREFILNLNQQIRLAGGALKYLRFDDSEYIDKLSREFDWSIDGSELLQRLLYFRFTRSKTVQSVADISDSSFLLHLKALFPQSMFSRRDA